VYKKAVWDFDHETVGAQDWVPELYSLSASYRSTMTDEPAGYIQHTEVDSSMQITTFSNKQFECFANTPYEDRMTHLDGTGSLVEVPHGSEIQKFADYKTPLNHLIVVRNRALIGNQDTDKFQLSKLENFKYYTNFLINCKET
jgi:hypothetical protein